MSSTTSDAFSGDDADRRASTVSSASQAARRDSTSSAPPQLRRESEGGEDRGGATARRDSALSSKTHLVRRDSSNGEVPALPSPSRRESVLSNKGNLVRRDSSAHEVDSAAAATTRRAGGSLRRFDSREADGNGNIAVEELTLAEVGASSSPSSGLQPPISPPSSSPSPSGLPPMSPSSLKAASTADRTSVVEKRGLSVFNSRPMVPSKLRGLIKRGSSSEKAPPLSADETPGSQTAAALEPPSPSASSTTSTTTTQEASGSLRLPRRGSSNASFSDQQQLVMSPGRSRIFTIDQQQQQQQQLPSPRRGSFLPSHVGGRKNSVRLSEADVGFLLGKVSKISTETLRQAARDGNTSLCEALVRGGVLIDDSDMTGQTALMRAAESGHGDTTLHLVEMGASLELKDENGMSALALAVNASKVATVRVLVEADADCESVSKTGDSVLTLALVKLQRSLGVEDEKERRVAYTQNAEICRIVFSGKKETSLPSSSRTKFDKPILFLVDEWARAKAAGEILVLPPIEKLIHGEKTLVSFLREHRKHVNLMAAVKIWFVVVFIVFDLAMREKTMTPIRLLTYVFLYLGAYYL